MKLDTAEIRQKILTNYLSDAEVLEICDAYDELREALEFYANEGHWTTGEYGPPETELITDGAGWDVARKALEDKDGE